MCGFDLSGEGGISPEISTFSLSRNTRKNNNNNNPKMKQQYLLVLLVVFVGLVLGINNNKISKRGEEIEEEVWGRRGRPEIVRGDDGLFAWGDRHRSSLLRSIPSNVANVRKEEVEGLWRKGEVRSGNSLWFVSLNGRFFFFFFLFIFFFFCS